MASKQIQLEGYMVNMGRMFGSGGQASVYEAYKAGLKYAAKRFQDKTVENLSNNELLLHQKSVKHPNVITIKGFCDWEDGCSAWVFMEFCKYGSLNEFSRDYPDQFKDKHIKVDLMLQIAAGLRFLHGLNLIHRDIKPSNILLTDENDQLIAKISDFGVSKDNIGTSTQTVVGTVPFFAPECWPLDVKRQCKYNEKVDIFALGLTFLAMIQESDDSGGLFPKVRGLKKAKQHMPIGELMYMMQLDGEPQLSVVTEDKGDDELTKVIKKVITAATKVVPGERTTAECIHEMLMPLGILCHTKAGKKLHTKHENKISL